MTPPPPSDVGESTPEEGDEVVVSRPDSADARDTAVVAAPITGRLSIVGNVPFTSVVLRRDMESVEMMGDLVPELRRLAGAVVEVRGRPVNATPPHSAALDVSEYEIVSIDGRRPHVGRLAERDGGTWLDNGDSVLLAHPPRELRGRHGARVWVIGELGEDGLTVVSYGIIRPE